MTKRVYVTGLIAKIIFKESNADFGPMAGYKSTRREFFGVIIEEMINGEVAESSVESFVKEIVFKSRGNKYWVDKIETPINAVCWPKKTTITQELIEEWAKAYTIDGVLDPKTLQKYITEKERLMKDVD